MSTSIPLNQVVEVNTGTVGSAAVGVTLAGLFLSDGEDIPFDITGGLVQEFPTLASVQDYFGVNSPAATYAANYFTPFTISLTIPPYLQIARYIYASPIAPYIRTAAFTDLAEMLTSIQAVTVGAITFVFNSTNVPLTALDFSSATSLDDVADILQTALKAALTSAASVVFNNIAGSVGPIGSFTASNGLVTGSDTVGYCPVSTLATLLGFTQAGGAVLSQGSLVLTAPQNMALIINITTDWSSFLHLFDTSSEMDYETDLALSAWSTTTNGKYQYLLYTEETNLAIQGNTSNIATPLAASNPNGTMGIFGTPALAAFVAGIGASIDYSAANSRLDTSFKTQDGLLPTVTNASVATALLEKKFNYYGKYSNSGNKWNWVYNGSIYGTLNYIAPYWDQRWLANAIANAGIELLLAVNSLPYNKSGYGQLNNAIRTGPIRAAQNNGVIQVGNQFTNAQVAQLIQQAGVDIAPNLTKSGYYIQVVPATPQERIDRAPIVVNVWYSNGGSILKIVINQIFVQ